MMLFLVSAHSIVESKRAHSGLLRTVFKSFGNKKLTRLDSNHMCTLASRKSVPIRSFIFRDFARPTCRIKDYMFVK